MEQKKVYTAIGLMSGTSLDGVDAALLETNGNEYVKSLGFIFIPYDDKLKTSIRRVFGKQQNDEGVADVERALTLVHIEAVKKLLIDTKRDFSEIDVIGFHGQTLFHDLVNGVTVQIGDGGLLARETGIDVVNKMRNEDVAAGGQGAPLLPLYHRAKILADNIMLPVAVLNIGGVSNVTWIGEGEDNILAFDTGSGNALLDDFIKKRTGMNFDKDGQIARNGISNKRILHSALSLEYFNRQAPKSLDRDEWKSVVMAVQGLSIEDGAATLADFTINSIKLAEDLFFEPSKQWVVTGGGRHNHYIMDVLSSVLASPVIFVEDIGWNGDALEAEGFAYLAVRSLLGEPLSLPTTTGVPIPQTGGTFYKAV